MTEPHGTVHQVGGGDASRPSPFRRSAPDRRQIACVDLFCGAGGLTHAFLLEGVRVTAGIDLDPACRYPYEANNSALFLQRDVRDLDGEAVSELFGTHAVRVLAGCAPCQPFSTYSQRYDARSDDKWWLLREFARLVAEVRPDVVTMENVPALRRYEVFREFVHSLTGHGYRVWHDVVDCANYGVPQRRKRLVLMASAYGPVSLVEPPAGADRPRTVRDAIGGMPAIAAGETHRQDALHVAAGLSDKNLARIRCSKPGGTWRDWPPELVAGCHKRGCGPKYPSVYGRMEWDQPSPTITTECYQYGSGRFGHPEQDRAISLREAALLQGFPPDYRFVPPGERPRLATVARLIGNAVPVELGRAIAHSIVRHVEGLPGISEHSRKKAVCDRIDSRSARQAT